MKSFEFGCDVLKFMLYANRFLCDDPFTRTELSM